VTFTLRFGSDRSKTLANETGCANAPIDRGSARSPHRSSAAPSSPQIAEGSLHRANAGASGAKSRFVHSPGRLLLSAALFSLVLLTLDLSLGSFLLIEQDRFDGRNPRQGVQAL
jgi:hypothetical protein